MRKLNVFGTAILVLTSLFVAGCEATSAGNQDRQAAETAAARARTDETQAADAGRKALNARLEEAQHHLDALQADAKPTSAKARRELDAQVKSLQSQVADLRAKLSSEQGRTEEWTKVKKSTEEAIQSIERKLDELTQPKR